jgi:hypothetical protein
MHQNKIVYFEERDIPVSGTPQIQLEQLGLNREKYQKCQKTILNMHARNAKALKEDDYR